MQGEDRQSDCRDRVRTARERLETVPMGSNGDARRIQPHQTVPPRTPPLQAPAPPRNQARQPEPFLSNAQTSATKPNVSVVTSSRRAPTRLFRPEHDSWMNTGAPTEQASSRDGSKQPTVNYWDPHFAPTSQVERSKLSNAQTKTNPANRASTTSSAGTIPDFPVPGSLETETPVQRLRGLNLGPPPTVRRGTSSYYSHSSVVAPIAEVEESPRVSQLTDVQSRISDSSEALHEHEDEIAGEEDEMSSDEARSSRRASDSTPVRNGGLVRQASLGRSYKAQPVLVRTPSQRTPPRVADESLQHASRFEEGSLSSEPLTPGIGMALTGPTQSVMPDHYAPGGNVQTPPLIAPPDSRSPASPLDPVVEQILGNLERGGALPSGIPTPIIESPFPRLRPTRLGETSKEDRTSMSSLTELIRRATKVRTNLDRGKTASRLGMLDMFKSSRPEKAKSPGDRTPTDSISGMIGWFPPPASSPLARDTGDHIGCEDLKGMVDQDIDMDDPSGTNRKDRRSCCGLPTWLFVLIILAIILLIAAAIIVPVMLLVVPHQNNPASNSLALCSSSHQCSNGGVSVIVNNACSCVCRNGFSGAFCADNGDSSCTSASVGSFDNATLGNAIPRLILSSSSNFSITLNTTSILSTFASSNLSCSDENGLVTFVNKAQRRSTHVDVMPLDVVSLGSIPNPTAAPHLKQYPLQIYKRDPTSVDSIILASSPTSTPSSSTTRMATSSASLAISTSTGATQKELDFARIAVLYIMQNQNFPSAQNARYSLDVLLSRQTFTAQAVDLGAGTIVDFTKATVTVNGTTAGTGKPFSSS